MGTTAVVEGASCACDLDSIDVKYVIESVDFGSLRILLFTILPLPQSGLSRHGTTDLAAPLKGVGLGGPDEPDDHARYGQHGEEAQKPLAPGGQ
jgi:hypothetical protein